MEVVGGELVREEEGGGREGGREGGRRGGREEGREGGGEGGREEGRGGEGQSRIGREEEGSREMEEVGGTLSLGGSRTALHRCRRCRGD